MMSSKDRSGGFEELEALIYRLFAEKQFALALLSLVMVAQLLSAQFLLLRLKPPAAQASAAPAAADRLDVQCAGGAAQLMSGQPMTAEGARNKTVVVHLGAAEEACLSAVTAAGVGELVVGMTSDAPGR